MVSKEDHRCEDRKGNNLKSLATLIVASSSQQTDSLVGMKLENLDMIKMASSS